MSNKLTRRTFVRGAAGASATLVIGSFNPRAYAANEKLRCAPSSSTMLMYWPA